MSEIAYGVRQGMPLSPFFANLLLKRFDKSIETAGIRMIRYADDLICFAESEAACWSIHKTIGAALNKEELTIPDPGPGSKTQIYKPEESAEFLGVSLRPEQGTYVLEIGSEQTQKIRQRLHDLADVSQLIQQNLNLSGFFKRLDGAISGYESAYEYCANIGHLRAVLDSSRTAAITRLFEQGLGFNFSTLSKEKKIFLGVN